jgi:hypothetical protein
VRQLIFPYQQQQQQKAHTRAQQVISKAQAHSKVNMASMATQGRRGNVSVCIIALVYLNNYCLLPDDS